VATVPATRRRAHRFELRLSDKERASLRTLARRAGLTDSGWVQRQIRIAYNELLGQPKGS